jgi:hypothetical protein
MAFALLFLAVTAYLALTVLRAFSRAVGLARVPLAQGISPLVALAPFWRRSVETDAANAHEPYSTASGARERSL